MIGVPKPREVYALDDYLVSDAAGLELRAYLERRPDALVLIERAAWAWLLDQTIEPVEGSMFWLGRVRSWPFRFLERWSSSHFGTAPLDEQVRKRHRWARTVGAHVLAHYSPAAEFGNWIVLSRPVEGE
jgi:hypothetical protein